MRTETAFYKLKKYIAEPLKVSKVDGEILAALKLPIEITAAKINRTALLSKGKNLLDVV